MMNASALLSLISDLYEQIAALRQNEQRLLARIAELEKPEPAKAE